MKLDDLDFKIDSCPICGGVDFTSLAKNDRHQLGIKTVGCKSCGLIQTNPRPSVIGLNDFYRNFYREFYQGIKVPTERYVLNLNKDERLKYTARRIIEKCNPMTNSVILDYGCGEGSLFVALKQAGFKGVMLGIEPNNEFAKYASETGGATVYDNLEKIDKKVDCIVVNHVLEHIHNPVDFLKKLSSTIKPNGYIYIDVPDVDFYKSINDLHIAHLYHFNMRTIRLIADCAGYDITSCEKHSPPYHPKSITMILAKSSIKASENFEYMMTTSDSESWHLIKKIQAESWVISLRIFLGKVPLIVGAYRLLKKIYSKL